VVPVVSLLVIAGPYEANHPLQPFRATTLDARTAAGASRGAD
jgi:hypothetical protein